MPATLRRRLGFSAGAVRRSLEAAAWGLAGLDRVEIADVHDPDEHLTDALAGAIPG